MLRGLRCAFKFNSKRAKMLRAERPCAGGGWTYCRTLDDISCSKHIGCGRYGRICARAQAYKNNPQLNVQRALVRATDEQVPQALAGYRPRVTATMTGGEQSLSTTSQLLPQPPGAPAQYLTNSGQNAPYSAGVTIAQTIYNGFQTANRTRAAEGQVFAARETLRNTEQTVLLNALTAYMNLLRDFAILELYKAQRHRLDRTAAGNSRSFQGRRCNDDRCVTG